MLGDLRLEPLVLAAAHVRELHAVRTRGGLGVQVDGDPVAAGDPGRELAGQLHARVHGRVAERHERDDVDGADPRVLAGVRVHVDVLDRLRHEPFQAGGDRAVLARDREHRAVVAGVRGAVEEEHVRRRGQGVGEALDDVEAATLGDVGHGLDEHQPMLQASGWPPEGRAPPPVHPVAAAHPSRGVRRRPGSRPARAHRADARLRAMSGPSRSLLRHPDFLKLWTAETISVFGSQISALAIPLIAVLTLKVSPFEVALLGTIEMLPFILFTLPAGAWVDRLRRRPIMIAGDLGRAVALVTIPLAYAFGALTIWQLYVVGFVTGVLTVFFDVSNQSYLPSIVERDQLVDGNSKLQVSLSAAQIAGPGIAGFLVGVLTAPIAILLDAALVRRVGVVHLPHPAARSRPSSTRPTRPASGARRSGATSAPASASSFRNPSLRAIAAGTATSNLFASIAFATLIVYLADPAYLGLGAGDDRRRLRDREHRRRSSAP